MQPFKAALAALLSLGLAFAALPAQAHPKRYTGIGVVDAVLKHGRALTITHHDIPGFMEAMTMTFNVADARLDKGIRPGDSIRFTVERRGHDFPIIALVKLKPGKAAKHGPGEAKAAPSPQPTAGGMKGMDMPGM